MSKLLDWIKANSKEGANIAEAEELVQKGTFDGITTKEQAIDFIGKNAAFKSAADSLISTAVSNHDEKFKAEKLPALIEEEKKKIQKELNPDETPEQKRIRELEEGIKARDQKDAIADRKSLLRTKAAELKADPLWAEKYYIYGDDAEKMMIAEHTDRQKSITDAVEAAKKDIYGNNQPPTGPEIPEDKIIKRDAFDQMSASDRMGAIKSGKVVID